jgi:hypothetical protein
MAIAERLNEDKSDNERGIEVELKVFSSDFGSTLRHLQLNVLLDFSPAHHGVAETEGNVTRNRRLNS